MEMDEQIIATRIRKLKQDSFHEYRDELIEIYEDVYTEQLNDPFFSSERYWSRLRAYATRDGFRAVAGEVDGTLIGYALGYTLPAETRWWQGLRSDVDAKALVETGTRTFALNEIMVRKRWRRRGIARQLHNSLIEEASEERATLLVLPDNVAAQAAYRSWGWQRLGELQPFDDAPIYDSMILDLTESRPAAD